MPAFDDDFAAADNVFDEVFGTETIIVTSPTGAEYTFDAVVGDETVEQRQTDMGMETVVARGFDIAIDRDGREDDGQPEVLNLYGTVTLGSITYAIEKITDSKAGRATLHCKRVSVGEKGRETYRRRNT